MGVTATVVRPLEISAPILGSRRATVTITNIEGADVTIDSGATVGSSANAMTVAPDRKTLLITLTY